MQNLCVLDPLLSLRRAVMMMDLSTTLSLRSAPSCSRPRPFHSPADVLQRPNRPVRIVTHCKFRSTPCCIPA